MLEPNEAERGAALQRVLESDELARSPKLSQLLLHICDESRFGHPEQLTEREIGVAVFGRSSHYDSSADNIVRVQVRNLRGRLARFYENEGADDAVIIEIPKGHYLPAFRRRAPPTSGRGWGGRDFRLARMGAAAALLVGFGALLGSWRATAVESADSNVAKLAARPHAPWSAVIEPGRRTLLIVPDSTYAMTQRLLGRGLTLEDYLAGGVEYPYRTRSVVPERLRRELDYLDLIVWRDQTSFTSLIETLAIVQMAGPLADQIEVLYPRDLSARGLAGKNVILLGPKRTLPWNEVYESRLSFRHHYDEETAAPYFENIAPVRGESRFYRQGGADGHANVTYTHLALLPDIEGGGAVLIIGGATDRAQTAVASRLMHPEQARRILLNIGVDDPDHPPFFEAILSSSRHPDVGSAIEVVVARIDGRAPPTRLTRAR